MVPGVDMNTTEPRTLFESLSRRLRETVKYPNPLQLDRPYHPVILRIGFHGEDGMLELVRDHVYWHAEHGDDAGLHIELNCAESEAWERMLCGIPERLRRARGQ
jgi:hypothetical protein